MKLSTFALSASVLAVACSSTLCAIPASANEVPSYAKKAFDVTLLNKTSTGDSTVRSTSDGKGKIRSEVDTKGQKSISIMDYPAGTITSLMVAQKMMLKMALPKADDVVTDAETAKKAGAKDLGTKTISGHPCHGWEVKKGDTTVQTWVGDDIHYLVHSETHSPKMNLSTDLKSYSAKAPDATFFDVPPGYKEMKMPGTPGQK